MKRPPTKQKSFKSYLEALNSSLKNAAAACRAEDMGPGMVTLGQTDSWEVGFVRDSGSTWWLMHSTVGVWEVGSLA